MIKIENVEVVGWEHAIRGMRNPKNSWDRSDSGCCADLKCTECPLYSKEESCCDHEGYFILGNNDRKLCNDLAKGGPVHAKYRRMIVVYLDITAPLYWWKEFDTYKVGTVSNSCSTMHKIHDKEFTLEDFSHEHLDEISMEILDDIVNALNANRRMFLALDGDEAKDNWWQMIQLLPTSYNQRRTIMLNYEVLVGIYRDRKNHKLDEWREFCKWIESLPYSELITAPAPSKLIAKIEPKIEYPVVPMLDESRKIVVKREDVTLPADKGIRFGIAGKGRGFRADVDKVIEDINIIYPPDAADRAIQRLNTLLAEECETLEEALKEEAQSND